jgi:DinB superfamily
MSSLGRDFADIYQRELDRLADEIAAYRSDADVWSTTGAQKNSPGTLAVHVAGGLMWFIGAALGHSDYVRNREREFSERGLSRDEIARQVRACRDTIVPVLRTLDDAALDAAYPGEAPARLRGITTRAFLLHLLWHLGWHVGQVYYHRLGIGEPAPA